MKTTGKNILLLLALLTAPMVAAEAQESVAMPFVDNALNPRSAAMGGISAGLSSDAYAQFGNIAAIPFSSDNLAAGVTYNSWQPTAAGINAGVAGAAYRLGRFGISFGASAAINQSYEGVSETGVSLGKFTPIDWQVGAGVSYLITDSFSAGIGLNYASSVTSAYYKDLNTFYADIQLMYVIRQFRISLSGNNLGLPVSSASGTKFNLPMNAALAVSYGNVWGRHGLEAGVEGKAYFGGPSAMGCTVGAEYEYDSLIAVRAGYHYGSEKNGLPSFASVGLGAHVFGVNLDVAYLIAAGNSPLRNTFSVGVGYSF
ncbi:MAG: PorV/PorQ family protein [Bacteroidetes bacterium]|uniref:PorV/PorQ family protein n=1 Tax=Candidatus Cryptobacteroides intestinavium TaxID=2840766 RepID=A0A9D9EQT9_9BACT|nr:PorV/PorQ family protein [Candidatus Cryptobacteroides intestinavium]